MKEFVSGVAAGARCAGGCRLGAYGVQHGSPPSERVPEATAGAATELRQLGRLVAEGRRAPGNGAYRADLHYGRDEPRCMRRRSAS